MPQNLYYSPWLHRTLISPLYHAAKTQGVPMTTLASRLIAEGLQRMNEETQVVRCLLAEDSFRYDPTERRSR